MNGRSIAGRLREPASASGKFGKVRSSTLILDIAHYRLFRHVLALKIIAQAYRNILLAGAFARFMLAARQNIGADHVETLRIELRFGEERNGGT